VFASGAPAALPLRTTVLIFVWAMRFLYAYPKPATSFGDFMHWFSFGILDDLTVKRAG